MADMISALKALYDALGGTLSDIPDGATNADVIEAIAAQIDEGGGGGSELPAVTSDDNGDVLTVVEGAWAKAAPSGGGSDIFVVTYTDNNGTLTYDKTFAEIYAAYSAGSMVFGTFASGCFILAGIDFAGPDEPETIHFISLNTNSTTVTICHIYHYPAAGSDPEEAIFTYTDVTGTIRT